MSKKDDQKQTKIPKKIKYYTLDKIVNKLQKSVIYEGTNTIIDEKVLIKVYNKEIIKLKNIEILRINNEIFLLKLINHKNILRIYEIIESPSFIFIIFEYFNGIKLTDFIKTNGRTPEEKAFHIYCQIISIISYIHDINICHLNLNPEIFLIDQNYNIKLCDFIYGEMYNKSDKKTNYEEEITNKYSCPEIHIQKPYNPEEADIWSSGVLIYYILMGELPFTAVNKYDLLKSILMADVYLPKSMSYNWKIMIKSLLELKESKRYKLKYLFLSPLFKENFIKKAQIENGLIIPINNDLINICHIYYGVNNEKLINDLNNNIFNQETSLYKQILNIFINKKIFEIDDKDHENETKENDEESPDTDSSQIEDKEKLKKEKLLKNSNLYLQKQKDFKKVMDNIIKNQENILKNLNVVKTKYLSLSQQKNKNENSKNKENLVKGIKLILKKTVKSRSNNDILKMKTLLDTKRIFHRRNTISFLNIVNISSFSNRNSKKRSSKLLYSSKKQLSNKSKKSYESNNKIIEAKKEEEESQKPLIDLSHLKNQGEILKMKQELKKDNDTNENKEEIENKKENDKKEIEIKNEENKDNFQEQKKEEIKEEIKEIEKEDKNKENIIENKNEEVEKEDKNKEKLKEYKNEENKDDKKT